MSKITASKDEQIRALKLIKKRTDLYYKIQKYFELYELEPKYNYVEVKSNNFKAILKVLDFRDRTKTNLSSEAYAKFDVTLEFYSKYLKQFFEISEFKIIDPLNYNSFTKYSLNKTLEFSPDKFKQYIELFSITKESLNNIDKNNFSIEFISKLESYFDIKIEEPKIKVDINDLILKLQNKEEYSNEILEDILLNKNDLYNEFIKNIYNNGTVQNIIGEIYEKNLNNLEQAFEFYTKSSENSNFRAKLNLARWYELGIFVKKNILKSLELYETVAKTENITALYKLGLIYDLGKEIPQDLDKAKKYYLKLIKYDHRDAILNLGAIYLKTKITEGEGLDLLNKALTLGNYRAYPCLGNYYEKKMDYKKAHYYYFEGSQKDNGTSYFCLGILYEKGLGCEKNIIKAKFYYNKAIELGYIKAKSFLDSLEKDKNYNLDSLEKSSQNGDVESKNILSKIYFDKKEYNKAKVYALEAVAKNSFESLYILGKIEEENDNLNQALDYYRIGREHKNYFCMNAEAWLYYKMKDYLKSEEIYINIIENFSPVNPSIYKILVRIYSNKQEYDKLEKFYNLIDELDKSKDIIKVYAFSLFKRKMYYEAINIYENKLTTNELTIGDYTILSRAFIYQEEYEKAFKYINLALKLEEDNVNLNKLKTDIIEKLKNSNEEKLSEDELFLEKISNEIIKTSDNIEPLKYSLLIENLNQKRINKDVIFCALGGGNEIGASSYFLKIDQLKFLIDCGYRIKKNNQGEYYPKLNTLYEHNLITTKNDLTSIILTHGHLDHIGSLIAVKDEFKNTPIYSSGATKDLAYFLLNEINLTKNSEFYDSDYDLKKYEQLLLENAIGSIYTKKIDEEIIGENYSIKFYEAGHILGARMILINIDGFKILITGDFSDFNQNLIPKYKLPEGLNVDILITESTHFEEKILPKREDQIQKLIDLVNEKSITGNVLIPAFSIGRSQEIASILSKAMKENKIQKMPIYIDGTAKVVSKIYEKHGVEIFDDFIKEAPLNLIYKFKAEKSIIISSSGMLLENCKASKYVEQLISDSNSAIIFTGYLSPNSKGYKLLESYSNEVETFTINRKKYPLKAKISNISLGAHVTPNGIEELIKNVNPKKVVLVHNNLSIKRNNIYDKLRENFKEVEIIQSYNKLLTYL